jgi:hypothetical protein
MEKCNKNYDIEFEARPCAIMRGIISDTETLSRLAITPSFSFISPGRFIAVLYLTDWSGWPIIGTIDAEPAPRKCVSGYVPPLPCGSFLIS